MRNILVTNFLQNFVELIRRMGDVLSQDWVVRTCSPPPPQPPFRGLSYDGNHCQRDGPPVEPEHHVEVLNQKWLSCLGSALLLQVE